jgi:hypothetical protein
MIQVSTARATDTLVACWAAPVPARQALDARLGPAEIAIEVYANHGRWIVECPDCRGAQIASRDLAFLCCVCANAAVGGLWRPVVWPEDVAEIDEVLAWRPTANQNWQPGESVVDLVAEAQAREGRAG